MYQDELDMLHDYLKLNNFVLTERLFNIITKNYRNMLVKKVDETDTSITYFLYLQDIGFSDTVKVVKDLKIKEGEN